jgi:hypothetical protein
MSFRYFCAKEATLMLIIEILNFKNFFSGQDYR